MTTCAHGPCACEVPEGDGFCADACRQSPEGEPPPECPCGHEPCVEAHA